MSSSIEKSGWDKHERTLIRLKGRGRSSSLVEVLLGPSQWVIGLLTMYDTPVGT